jgi:hypothetical protein
MSAAVRKMIASGFSHFCALQEGDKNLNTDCYSSGSSESSIYILSVINLRI